MKKSINLLLTYLLVNTLAFSQNPDTVKLVPVDEETNLITYQETENQVGTKSELYNRANDWFKSYYPNPGNVTKIKDIEKGLLTGIARLRIFDYDKKGNKFPAGTIQYSIKVDLKDGKYRLTLSKFNLLGASYFPLERWLNEPKLYTKRNKIFLKQLDDKMKELIINFHTLMLPKKKPDTDW